MKMNEMLHYVKAAATRALQVLAIARQMFLLRAGDLIVVTRNEEGATKGQLLKKCGDHFAAKPTFPAPVFSVLSDEDDIFDLPCEDEDFDPFADESELVNENGHAASTAVLEREYEDNEDAAIRDVCGLRRYHNVIAVSHQDSSPLSRAMAASGRGTEAWLN